MASVPTVSSTEFRATLTPQQNSAPEGDDPFSLLLNAVTDVKAGVREPDAPQATERRNDVPAKQTKPEADEDRQAKRNAPDPEKPEGKPQAGSTAPVKATATEEESEDTESDTGDENPAAIDALLMIANETQQQAAISPQAAVNANADAQAAPAIIATVQQATAEIETVPALVAAIADVTMAASTETQPVQTVQSASGARPKFEIAPVSAQMEAEVEIALPKISAESLSSLLKPLKHDAQAQVQTQPGSVQVANAIPVQGPAPLEMLNAAISKHIQFAAGADTNEQPQDAPKPLISSTAAAPNFAMTAQVNAPVTVQTQQVTELSRTVPLDQIAVEIATRAGKGERRFDIRLDPPELGRIDVRLEIDSKGNTTTKLIVERVETLDMLQRDARGLEKALQNAGLKLDAGGMQFSLQQDSQAQHGNQNHAAEMRGRPDRVEADTEIMTEISVGNASLAAQIRGGVDIRI